MRPSQVLALHRAEIRQIVERNRAGNARIFGSVVHGRDREGSDLDLLVDPTPDTTLMDIANIQLEAEDLLGIRVDVLTPKFLPLKFRAQALQESEPV